MRRRIAAVAAGVLGAVAISCGAGADQGGNGHGHGHGNAGINGTYAFTGASQCIWASSTPAPAFTNGKPNNPSFSTSNSISGALTIGGNVSVDIVLINQSASLGGPGVSEAPNLSGSSAINKNVLTLSDVTGMVSSGPLSGARVTVNKIVLAGVGSQDHKTLVLTGADSTVETVTFNGGPTPGSFDRICQYSITAVRTGGGPEGTD